MPVLTSKISLNLLIKLTNQKIIFPFYHAISDEDIIHIKHLYKVRTKAQFINDLDLLLKYYHPVSHEDLLNSVKQNKPLQGKCFMLSFDDGLREFHDIIAPILIRKGIPAVCFLNTAFIDNKALFYRYKASILIGEFEKGKCSPATLKTVQQWFLNNRLSQSFDKTLRRVSYSQKDLLDKLAVLMGYDFPGYLKVNRPYLTSIQIEKLISQGFAFGAHSIDHPEYRFISEEEQFSQTRESIKDVCGKFGLSYRLFSFPFTDSGVKRNFFQKIFDPEQPVADITFGGAGLKRDCMSSHLQRIPFEETSLSAKQILLSEYFYYLLKAFAGRNRIKR
jgi:peptidoglycan/xylan/chitin deacetylase (PgdA/CDA1 family)